MDSEKAYKKALKEARIQVAKKTSERVDLYKTLMDLETEIKSLQETIVALQKVLGEKEKVHKVKMVNFDKPATIAHACFVIILRNGAPMRARMILEKLKKEFPYLSKVKTIATIRTTLNQLTASNKLKRISRGRFGIEGRD